MSVSFLMMSPLARGLFKNALSQSGTALTYTTVCSQEKAAAGLKEIVKHLGVCLFTHIMYILFTDTCMHIF